MSVKDKMKWDKVKSGYKSGEYLIKSDRKGGYKAFKNNELLGWARTLIQIKKDVYYIRAGVRL